MKFFTLLIVACSFSFAFSQTHKIEIVYLLPGQGSDSNIFNNLKLSQNFQLKNIYYPIPPKNCSMEDYSKIIAQQIDTNKTFALIGVSMGGMICTELTDILHPEKVIIVASAKCRKELPFRYRFQKQIPINKIIPNSIIKLGAKTLQPIVEPDRNKYKEVFKGMLQRKNKIFMKRSVNMIVNWNKKKYSDKINHIHGTADKTLPIRNIKTKYIITKGSHMMMLTKADEINVIINEILNSK